MVGDFFFFIIMKRGSSSWLIWDLYNNNRMEESLRLQPGSREKNRGNVASRSSFTVVQHWCSQTLWVWGDRVSFVFLFKNIGISFWEMLCVNFSPLVAILYKNLIWHHVLYILHWHLHWRADWAHIIIYLFFNLEIQLITTYKYK